MKELLNLVTPRLKRMQIDEQFSEIAQKLFGEYCIIKGGHRYEFLEIEFYYYSKFHPDATTLPRESPVGNWYIHRFGVDISFESKFFEKKEDDFFGGILIRALLKDSNEIIAGPLRCSAELFNGISAFGPLLEALPKVERTSPKNSLKIEKTIRQMSSLSKPPAYWNSKNLAEANAVYDCVRGEYCYYNPYMIDTEWKQGRQKYNGVLPWLRKEKL